ncbi:MAG: acyl carrier protein [Polyangiaceae bacterium]
MSTETKVRDLLCAYCTVPEQAGATLEIDSLSLIQLVEELEVAFDIRVLPSEASPANFGTVERLVAFVEGKGR